MPWKQPALPTEFAYHSKRRAGALKRSKHQFHTVPHLFVRINNDAADRVINKSDWQGHLKLPPFGFVECTTAQTSPQQMQLCLAHRSFQTEQQPIVEMCRIIEAVFVEDQRASEGADLQQPMPVTAVTGQSGDLEPEYQSGSPKTHFSHQALETNAVRGGGSRLAEVR